MPDPRIFYINREGMEIELSVTGHAMLRFMERYELVYFKKIDPAKVLEVMARVFNGSRPLTNLSDNYKKRFKRHGKTSVLFKADKFIFIVCQLEIVTVEINGDLRYLNRKSIKQYRVIKEIKPAPQILKYGLYWTEEELKKLNKLTEMAELEEAADGALQIFTVGTKSVEKIYKYRKYWSEDQLKRFEEKMAKCHEKWYPNEEKGDKNDVGQR